MPPNSIGILLFPIPPLFHPPDDPPPELPTPPDDPNPPPDPPLFLAIGSISTSLPMVIGLPFLSLRTAPALGLIAAAACAAAAAAAANHAALTCSAACLPA